MNTGAQPPKNTANPGLDASDDALKRDPWLWWRSQMPVAEKWTYFDHAAVAPLSQPAVDAAAEFLRQASEAGDMHWPEWAKTAENLRKSFAKLISANPSEISLVPNTTAGINLVAEGFPWESGDNVVVPEGEFPSNLLPWINQEPRGVETRIVPRREGRVIVDDLIARCDHRTRIISASWVGFASGYRLDLAELTEKAHQRGIKVFVDAIQGLGMHDLNVQQIPIDFMAADGHKWLLGPEGAGMAMIRSEHLEILRCRTVGWNSVNNSHTFAGTKLELKSAANRFEGGSANMLGLACLNASLNLFHRVREAHGHDAIENRVVELAGTLDHLLSEQNIRTRLPSDRLHQSGIVTINVAPADPALVRQSGIAKQIVTSHRDGGLRASIHAYNTPDELQLLVDVIAQSHTE